jgi:hypothetical protein
MMSPKRSMSARTSDSSLFKQRRRVRGVVAARGQAHLDALDARGEEGDRDPVVIDQFVEAIATDSASADSLAPQVRRTRLMITDVVPGALASHQVGQDRAFEHVGHLVGHARHGVDDLLADGQISPGAVPRVCGMIVAPRGTSACRRLFSGIARPRAPNIARIFSTIASSRSNSTFITSASAARVMSSWVGTEPSAHDDRVASRECRSKGEEDPLVVVAHVLVELRRDAVGRELFAEPLRVRVGI